MQTASVCVLINYDICLKVRPIDYHNTSSVSTEDYSCEKPMSLLIDYHNTIPLGTFEKLSLSRMSTLFSSLILCNSEIANHFTVMHGTIMLLNFQQEALR